MWQRYMDSQYRRPFGLVGRWIGRTMARQHQPENRWTVDLLDVQPSDHVLEVGFGPGIAVEAVAQRISGGLVAGVDFSPTMVAAARRRNAARVRAGMVDLRLGDAARLPFADGVFDKAFSIHSIYFWPEPLAALREIRRVLKPNGLLILTVLPKEKWNPEHPELAGTPECIPYSGDDLTALLTQAGFGDLHSEADANQTAASNFSVLGRALLASR
ncbi:MAG TPA: class I SAM-dependent methyltransferase [Phototrophicaceae bacterium]|nr:class I SAM-dependent methyltransferase [Phototrophicaceae bacterium]